MAILGPFLIYFRSFQRNNTNFTTNVKKCPELEFELTTFWLWVSSFNHYTGAPTLGSFELALIFFRILKWWEKAWKMNIKFNLVFVLLLCDGCLRRIWLLEERIAERERERVSAQVKRIWLCALCVWICYQLGCEKEREREKREKDEVKDLGCWSGWSCKSEFRKSDTTL